MLNEQFGPSIRLLILDLFLENPTELMNLREIARKVDINPGSISRVLPQLVGENQFLEQIMISKERAVYRLNTKSEVIKSLQDCHKKLQHVISSTGLNSRGHDEQFELRHRENTT